jgi:outer membrane biosynthesis protein TonB
VLLQRLISTTGQVVHARVIKSAARLLDDAAIDTALKWVYEPVIVDGRAVPAMMTAVVAFHESPVIPGPSQAPRAMVLGYGAPAHPR